MNSKTQTFVAPFPPGYRGSGILLHVTSLPSSYGIGDVGPTAFAWVDQLAAAGQTWWQMLPLGPTGCGHSPYQALSSFAANPLIISPDQLMEDGLLTQQDCKSGTFASDRVDFNMVISFKERLLARAWSNFRKGGQVELQRAFKQFCEEKEGLLMEPALFMALRTRYGEKPFQQWPRALARREPKAMAKERRDLVGEIEQFLFGQFILLRHWKRLKDYANQRGVRLLGDLPIFVSPDSADVWANPELFLLDHNLKPRFVAGVPPDYYSADGQLWGNPLYDWEALRKTGYRWWIERLQVRLEYLDAIRLDHFRGFEAAWHVPPGASTAVVGQWVPGPGADFFEHVRGTLGRLPLLAEDLGVITPAVAALRDQFELPGMRILQFAFDGDPANPHLPHHHIHNSIAYTGTHDNDTTLGWYDTLPETRRRFLWDYLGRPPGGRDEAVWSLIRLALSSAAAVAVTPCQDLLGLGSGARMNVPGRADGQWLWRCPQNTLGHPAWEQLLELTEATGRLAKRSGKKALPEICLGPNNVLPQTVEGHFTTIEHKKPIKPMIVTTDQLFKIAYGKYAIGAYNINNGEQAMGLFKGCLSSQAPFIIQISKGARKYTDKRMLEAIIRAAAEIFPEAIFAVHLDHGDEETCYDCIDSGFYSSVMIDASHESFEANVAITKRVVDRAHAKGISVEAELGMLGGVEEDIKVEEGSACLTDPAEAERFVKLTGCDSLACAIGTSHGAFKFKGKQALHFDVLQRIKAQLPGFPLVMHGSSSVPKEEVDRINAAGGKIAGSMGVDPKEYLPAAKLGVTKVNIDTDGRLVWTRVHREFFRDKAGEFDFRPPGKIFMEEYAKFIASRNRLLGSAGQLPVVRAAVKDNREEIARRAYFLWEQAGRPEGRDRELWLEAESDCRCSSDVGSR